MSSLSLLLRKKIQQSISSSNHLLYELSQVIKRYHARETAELQNDNIHSTYEYFCSTKDDPKPIVFVSRSVMAPNSPSMRVRKKLKNVLFSVFSSSASSTYKIVDGLTHTTDSIMFYHSASKLQTTKTWGWMVQSYRKRKSKKRALFSNRIFIYDKYSQFTKWNDYGWRKIKSCRVW